MSDQDSSQHQDVWEQKVIKEILLEHITERRRKRRWSIFFKLIIVGIIGFFIWQATVGSNIVDKKYAELEGDHIAKITINGVISEKSEANADDIIYSLNKAHKKENVAAIILDINSPGGTPVQARRIFNEIRALQAENKETKIYAVINDIGTSAAYLIASATFEIYADETSFVGSIGVLVNSFGFVDVLKNLGIERRLYVAGKHKGMLDPFSPETEEHKKFIAQSLEVVHQEFINNVKVGRGDKLKDNSDLYSGRFWTGKEARNLGLIDGFADINRLSREVLKVSKVVDYTKSPNLFDKITRGFAGSIKSFLMNSFFEAS